MSDLSSVINQNVTCPTAFGFYKCSFLLAQAFAHQQKNLQHPFPKCLLLRWMRLLETFATNCGILVLDKSQ
jgi:hypothetical protein